MTRTWGQLAEVPVESSVGDGGRSLRPLDGLSRHLNEDGKGQR